LGERRGAEELLLRLRARGLGPDALAGFRELDLDAAPVPGIGYATDEPRLLEPVEPVRHRPTRELEFARELTRRAAISVAHTPEYLPFTPGQIPRAERLFVRVPKTALEAVDPVDDPLDLVVEARDALEALEK